MRRRVIWRREEKLSIDLFQIQGFDRSLEQSSDAIRAKASWLKRDKGDVESWLSENGYLAKSGQKL